MNKLNLKIPAEAKDKLIELQNRTGATNMTEVIRRSLSLYDQITSELNRNNSRFVVQKLDDAGAVKEEIRIMIL